MHYLYGENRSIITCFPSSPEYLKRDQILQPGSLQTDPTHVTLFLPFCHFSEFNTEVDLIQSGSDLGFVDTYP